MRVAIVGASRIAARTLPAWRTIPEVSIAGFYSRNITAAREFSRHHGVDFLGTPESGSIEQVDAVYISSLNVHHGADTQRFLDRGKHVLVEKPFVMSHAEAQACFSLARGKGVHLQEGMMHRLHPELQAFGRAIREGRIGTLEEIDLNFGFVLETHGRARRTVAGGGGAVADLGCYLIDFLTWQFGPWDCSDIRLTPGWEIDSNGQRLDSTAHISFVMNATVLVRLWCSISKASRNLWEARGTQGAITLDRHDPQTWRNFSMTLINEDSEKLILPIEDSEAQPMESSLFLFQRQFSNFTQACQRAAEPLVSEADSLQNARVLEIFLSEISARRPLVLPVI